MKKMVAILDFVIPLIPNVILAVILSGILENEIIFLKKHPYTSIAVVIIVYIALSITRFYLNKQIENDKIKAVEEKLKKSQEEITFYQQLISSFKQQICEELENQLCKVFNSLKFNNQHRITVYTYTAGVFFSIGRYSKNASFAKFGRIAIKGQDEFLFKVWNSGEEQIRTLNSNQISKRNMKTKKLVYFFFIQKMKNCQKKINLALLFLRAPIKKIKL